MMTNANVAAVVQAAGGRELTLEYTGNTENPRAGGGAYRHDGACGPLVPEAR